MSKKQLFILGEATFTLYPASNGEAVVDQPIWMGGCAENLRLNSSLEEILIAPTGAAYKEAYHVDEQHEISIERLWVLKADDLKDYTLVRNQRYVLEIVWSDEKAWHKRTYYGVTARAYNLASNGVMEFGAEQTFRAQYYKSASGSDVYTPIGTDAKKETPVLFTHDGAVLHTDNVEAYFLGHYKWPVAVNVLSAKAIGRAGQGTPSTFTLEIGGSLSTATLSLPTGTVNQEVNVESAYSGISVPANTPVRWKATAGPSNVVDCPYAVAIVMQVKPV